MIQFTQFLRPNGKRKTVEIERPPNIEKAAFALVAGGCRFEIEELSSGMVSMTVEHPALEDDGETLAHELCQNGPEVPDHIDRLIETAAAAYTRRIR